MSDRVKGALIWLKGILESEKIDYQIVGGLAATIHGGSREVAYIDLYIRDSDSDKLLARVASYLKAFSTLRGIRLGFRVFLTNLPFTKN